MKKLNKLQINSDKKLNTDELLSLKGGYGGLTCGPNSTHFWCWCYYNVGQWEACYHTDHWEDSVRTAIDEYCYGEGYCVNM